MNKTLLYGYLALALSACLVKGNALPWASLYWSAAVLLLTVLLSYQLLSRHQSTQHSRLAIPTPFFVLLLFQTWVLCQYIFGLSYNLNTSLQTFIAGVSICCVAISISILQTQGTRQSLYTAMIAMGFMQALYGLFNQATNTQKILWMDKTHYFEQATGTFVNPNHFCAYLIIIVCLIAGKLLATLESRGKKKKPPKLVTIVSSVYSIEALVLVILVLAILASKSMGGLLSLGAVVAAIYLLLLKKPLSKRILLAPTAMVIFTLASILTIDSQLIFQELGGLQQSIERRTELWTASARVVKEHWAFGIGGGAFYSMFTQYRDLDIGNNFYYYAHNDYIQFLAEFGLIGATLLLLFIVLTIKCNYRAIQNSNSIHSKTFGYSSILATVAVATHSIVDFPLQIPAYAVLYLVIISVNIPAYAKHIKISGNGTL